MKKILFTAAVSLMAGSFLMSARAEHHEGDKKHASGMESAADHMKEKLGITDDQQAKLKAARRAKRDGSEAAMSQMHSQLRKLADQLEDKASDAEISATLEKVSAARKAMLAEDEKYETALASILTPTQRAKMAVAMTKRMHGGKRGMGGMHGGMKGGGMKHDGMKHGEKEGPVEE